MANAAPIETPAEAPVEIWGTQTVAAVEANKPKMVPIKLSRHYRPKGDYEVMGYDQPEKKVRRPDGVMMVVQQAEFVAELEDDESSQNFGKIRPAPAPLPGTGTGGKIWAGTTLRLPVEEAKYVRRHGIGVPEIDD